MKSRPRFLVGRGRGEAGIRDELHAGARSMRPRVLVAAVIILALAGGCAAVVGEEPRTGAIAGHDAPDSLPWRYQPDLASLWSTFLDSNRDTDVVLSDDSFLLIEEISKQPTPFYGYLGRSYVAPPQTKALSPDLQLCGGTAGFKEPGKHGRIQTGATHTGDGSIGQKDPLV